jgi:hypothetical protein
MSNPAYRLADGNYSWDEVNNTVLSYPRHTDLIVATWMVPQLPVDFKQRFGFLFNGRLAHYSKSLPDGKGIHIKVYKDHYEVHWDEKDPNKDPLGHLYYDAPEYLAAIAIGAGIGIGAYAYHRHTKNQKRRL